jgi:hypothetical protein
MMSIPSSRFAKIISRSFLILALIAFTEVASGQEGARSSSSSRKTLTSNRSENQELKVTESFAPTIKVEPLFHRLEGRPSDVIPFKFQVESSNRETEVEVVTVGLDQDITGQIRHDELALQADLIRLITPTKLRVPANTPTFIEGAVRIPKGDARFHTLGLLVRDNGQGKAPSPQFNADGTPKTQAAVRFMTQYLLRLDLLVAGVRGEQGQQLSFDSLAITPFEGRPRLQAIVSNPSNTAFEFEVRARLRSSPSDRSFKPLRLAMPIRATVEDETRYTGRILPKSRVRMEDLLPEAIAGGRYYCDMELVFDNQVVNRRTFDVDVRAQDFPAQEVLIAQVGEDLQVSPAQVELSQLRGGSRRLTMLLKNSGRDTKQISLKAITESELEINAVTIQPDEVQLAPGSSRKIALTLRSQNTDNRFVEYGHILVQSKSDDRDFLETKKLPLAVVLKKISSTQISMSPLQWDSGSEYPGFRTKIDNLGDTHMPLQARLMVVDPNGRRISIPSGFGRWLMPRSSTHLEFRFDQPLSLGEYQLRCELQQEGEPIVTQQQFVVSDLENSVSARK